MFINSFVVRCGEVPTKWRVDQRTEGSSAKTEWEEGFRRSRPRLREEKNEKGKRKIVGKDSEDWRGREEKKKEMVYVGRGGRRNVRQEERVRNW